MQPHDLKPDQFNGYPPEARKLAVNYIGSLQRLPLSFLPNLLREVIEYDFKFPIERKAVEKELANLAYRQAKNSFTIPGIGKLVLVNRKARIGRNPATGQEIQIPAKKVVKFRVAKAAKDSIVPPKAGGAKAPAKAPVKKSK